MSQSSQATQRINKTVNKINTNKQEIQEESQKEGVQNKDPL